MIIPGLVVPEREGGLSGHGTALRLCPALVKLEPVTAVEGPGEAVLPLLPLPLLLLFALVLLLSSGLALLLLALFEREEPLERSG